MAALDVQSSNSPPDLQKFNIQDQLKNRLHPPTHPACRPQRGLPLASPSLSLGRQPKTGLQQQAQAVLTPPQQSQSVGFSPFGSSATPFVCLLFLKEILFNFLKKHLKKKEKIKRNKVKKRIFKFLAEEKKLPCSQILPLFKEYSSPLLYHFFLRRSNYFLSRTNSLNSSPLKKPNFFLNKYATSALAVEKNTCLLDLVTISLK